MPDGANGAAEVDAWFERLEPEQRRALTALRSRIRDLVPGASEKISYGVPTFVLDGSLLALNATRSGLSLITMRPDLLEAMSEELAGLSWSGSTLRFTPEHPLPDDVVRAVVLARVEQNRAGQKEH